MDSGGEGVGLGLSYLRSDGGLFLSLTLLLALNPKTDPLYTKNGHCTSSTTGGTIISGHVSGHRRLPPWRPGSGLASTSGRHPAGIQADGSGNTRDRGPCSPDQADGRDGDPGSLATPGGPGGEVAGLGADCDREGGVTEWTKVAVLKTAVARATVGSNPTPSATPEMSRDKG